MLCAKGKHDVGLGMQTVVIPPKSDYRPHHSQGPLKQEAIDGITPVFNSLLKAGVVVPCENSPVVTPCRTCKQWMTLFNWTECRKSSYSSFSSSTWQQMAFRRRFGECIHFRFSTTGVTPIKIRPTPQTGLSVRRTEVSEAAEQLALCTSVYRTVTTCWGERLWKRKIRDSNAILNLIMCLIKWCNRHFSGWAGPSSISSRVNRKLKETKWPSGILERQNRTSAT